jgi:methylated-DNA-[protein]-cysteine S-methyltransferase
LAHFRKPQIRRLRTATSAAARLLSRAVKRYFADERTDFPDLRLDLGAQDELFQRIYAAVRRVGWGSTTTYGAVAKELGAGPEAACDVGQAMAKNPVPLIIP